MTISPPTVAHPAEHQHWHPPHHGAPQRPEIGVSPSIWVGEHESNVCQDPQPLFIVCRHPVPISRLPLQYPPLRLSYHSDNLTTSVSDIEESNTEVCYALRPHHCCQRGFDTFLPCFPLPNGALWAESLMCVTLSSSWSWVRVPYIFPWMVSEECASLHEDFVYTLVFIIIPWQVVDFNVYDYSMKCILIYNLHYSTYCVRVIAEVRYFNSSPCSGSR